MSKDTQKIPTVKFPYGNFFYEILNEIKSSQHRMEENVLEIKSSQHRMEGKIDEIQNFLIKFSSNFTFLKKEQRDISEKMFLMNYELDRFTDFFQSDRSNPIGKYIMLSKRLFSNWDDLDECMSEPKREICTH